METIAPEASDTVETRETTATEAPDTVEITETTAPEASGTTETPSETTTAAADDSSRKVALYFTNWYDIRPHNRQAR